MMNVQIQEQGFTQAQIDTMFNDLVRESRGLDYDMTGVEVIEVWDNETESYEYVPVLVPVV